MHTGLGLNARPAKPTTGEQVDSILVLATSARAAPPGLRINKRPYLDALPGMRRVRCIVLGERHVWAHRIRRETKSAPNPPGRSRIRTTILPKTETLKLLTCHRHLSARVEVLEQAHLGRFLLLQVVPSIARFVPGWHGRVSTGGDLRDDSDPSIEQLWGSISVEESDALQNSSRGLICNPPGRPASARLGTRTLNAILRNVTCWSVLAERVDWGAYRGVQTMLVLDDLSGRSCP